MANQPTNALLEDKPIRSLAYAEAVLREWSAYFDVSTRLDPNFGYNLIPLATYQRAQRAYLYIQRHERKQQTVRDTQ